MSKHFFSREIFLFFCGPRKLLALNLFRYGAVHCNGGLMELPEPMLLSEPSFYYEKQQCKMELRRSRASSIFLVFGSAEKLGIMGKCFFQKRTRRLVKFGWGSQATK